MKSLFKRKNHSLTARLVFLFIVIAILLMVFVGASMRFAFRSNFKENILPHLFLYMEYIQKDIGTPPDFNRAKELVERLPVDVHLMFDQKQWSSTDTLLDFKNMDYYKQFSEGGVDYALGELEGQDFLVRKHQDYTIAFSVPHPRHFWGWRIAVPLLIALVLLMILYHRTRRIFSPIQVIKDGVKKIGEGDLEHKIELNQCNEFGDLSNSINLMAGDIRQMLEAKRQLLLAISHELRSPMTRVKVSTEMLQDEKAREDINRELSEMDNLIAELLETERLNTRHRVLNLTHVSLNDLITELVNEYFKDRPPELHLPKSDIKANVDPVRIKLLLKNLLDNALRYTPKGANPPKLSLKQSENEITLTVQDYGKGIDEKNIPFLTEPFYRVDPARQRQTGGYGLGLYLCRIIAEAHQGTLEIKSQPEKGTEILVTLPIS